SDTVKSSLKTQGVGLAGTSSSGTPGTAAGTTSDFFQLTGIQTVTAPGMWYATFAARTMLTGGTGGFQFNNNPNSEMLMTLQNVGAAGRLTINAPDTTNGAALRLRQANNNNYGYDFDTETLTTGRLDLYGVNNNVRQRLFSFNRNFGVSLFAPDTTASP